MTQRRDGQLPLEALRDLIGICRALFVAWKSNGMGPVELDELAGIGKDLGEALKLARRAEPNTLGHRAAWSRAEDAAKRLGHLVGKLEPLAPTIAAATERVCGRQASSATAEREAKKKHRRMRS